MAENATTGVWTNEALTTILITRIHASLSRLEDAEATRNLDARDRAFMRQRPVLKELVSLAQELGCDDAVEEGRLGYRLYYGSDI